MHDITYSILMRKAEKSSSWALTLCSFMHILSNLFHPYGCWKRSVSIIPAPTKMMKLKVHSDWHRDQFCRDQIAKGMGRVPYQQGDGTWLSIRHQSCFSDKKNQCISSSSGLGQMKRVLDLAAYGLSRKG